MSSVIYWLKEELNFCLPAQLESSARLQLGKVILPANKNRKIQQMALDIGWAVMAEGLKGYVDSVLHSRTKENKIDRFIVS